MHTNFSIQSAPSPIMCADGSTTVATTETSTTSTVADSSDSFSGSTDSIDTSSTEDTTPSNKDEITQALQNSAYAGDSTKNIDTMESSSNNYYDQVEAQNAL